MLADMDTSFGECVNQKQVSVIHEMENRVHILRQPKEIALEHSVIATGIQTFQMRKHWFDYVVRELVFMI